MAIQFHCPSCTAAVRVSDESAGRQGRCPKCDILLIVPNIPIPPQSGSGPAQATPSDLLDTGPTVRRNADVTMLSGAADASGRTSAAGDTFRLPDFPESLNTPRHRSRHRSRRNSQRIWIIGIPVLCFLVLFAILASFMISRLPELRGTLNADSLADVRLPSKELSWSDTGLSTDDQLALQNALVAEPASFSSSLMSCSLTATDTGIQVRLRAADGQQWYLVDPAESPALVLWLRRQESQVAGLRAAELEASLAKFASEKLQLAAGEPIVLDAQNYRDSVGLNACVGVLGYVLEAVVPGRAARCAFEDDHGRLYFLLPAGTASFQLQGRSLANGPSPFPGEFQVNVRSSTPAESGNIEVPTTSEPSDSEPTMQPLSAPATDTSGDAFTDPVPDSQKEPRSEQADR